MEKDKYGNVNPFQDPSRGRLDVLVGDDDGEINLDGTVMLLQNLAGRNSLIGRSITLFEEDGEGGFDILGCCVIARDQAPVVEQPESGEAGGE